MQVWRYVYIAWHIFHVSNPCGNSTRILITKLKRDNTGALDMSREFRLKQNLFSMLNINSIFLLTYASAPVYFYKDKSGSFIMEGWRHITCVVIHTHSKRRSCVLHTRCTPLFFPFNESNIILQNWLIELQCTLWWKDPVVLEISQRNTFCKT